MENLVSMRKNSLFEREKFRLIVWESIQLSLRKYIDLKDRVKKVDIVAGVDVSYRGGWTRGCVCVMNYNNWEEQEIVTLQEQVSFPYISGYLSFREAPIVLRVISRLKNCPDCFILDGNGILHPRNMGLATFIGIILRRPTIGCAKSLLIGKYRKPGRDRGAFSYIKYKKDTLGVALRTKKGVKEIYISAGWGISLEKAVKIVLRLSRHRLPECLRLAHIYAGQER